MTPASLNRANLGVRTAPYRSSTRPSCGASLRIGTALASGLVVVLTVPAARAQSVPASGNLLPVLDAVHGIAPATVTASATNVSVNLNDNNQVVTWKSFDIGTGNSVTFGTADTTTKLSIINRVVGDGTQLYKSEIYGALQGQDNVAVWLINPSGVTFGPGGTYAGGSLVLSTLDFSTEQEAEDFADSTATSRDVTGSGGKIDLNGSGALTSSGTTLLLGEDIHVGKSINPAAPWAAARARSRSHSRTRYGSAPGWAIRCHSPFLRAPRSASRPFRSPTTRRSRAPASSSWPHPPLR